MQVSIILNNVQKAPFVVNPVFFCCNIQQSVRTGYWAKINQV